MAGNGVNSFLMDPIYKCHNNYKLCFPVPFLIVSTWSGDPTPSYRVAFKFIR